VAELRIARSFGSTTNCHDSAAVETVRSTLKRELDQKRLGFCFPAGYEAAHSGHRVKTRESAARRSARQTPASRRLAIGRYDLAMADETMTSGRNLQERVSYLGRAALVVGSHPLEGLDRIRGRTEIVLCKYLPFVTGQKPSATTTEPVKNLHELLGLEWPCPLEQDFNDTWTDLEGNMASMGLKVGKGHDADANLAHVVWCAIRHMDPLRVLETGVARGVTSVLALRALSQSNRGVGGRLWSIDLPPMMPGWHEQSRVLVDETAWPEWTYIRGSSRRTMTSTCAAMKSVDIFVHDSLHTPQTMKYEFEKVWPLMDAGGLLISDDVEGSSIFVDFVNSHHVEKWFTAPKADKDGLFGVALKA